MAAAGEFDLNKDLLEQIMIPLGQELLSESNELKDNLCALLLRDGQHALVERIYKIKQINYTSISELVAIIQEVYTLYSAQQESLAAEVAFLTEAFYHATYLSYVASVHDTFVVVKDLFIDEAAYELTLAPKKTVERVIDFEPSTTKRQVLTDAQAEKLFQRFVTTPAMQAANHLTSAYCIPVMSTVKNSIMGLSAVAKQDTEQAYNRIIKLTSHTLTPPTAQAAAEPSSSWIPTINPSKLFNLQQIYDAMIMNLQTVPREHFMNMTGDALLNGLAKLAEMHAKVMQDIDDLFYAFRDNIEPWLEDPSLASEHFKAHAAHIGIDLSASGVNHARTENVWKLYHHARAQAQSQPGLILSDVLKSCPVNKKAKPYQYHLHTINELEISLNRIAQAVGYESIHDLHLSNQLLRKEPDLMNKISEATAYLHRKAMRIEGEHYRRHPDAQSRAAWAMGMIWSEDTSKAIFVNKYDLKADEPERLLNIHAENEEDRAFLEDAEDEFKGLGFRSMKEAIEFYQRRAKIKGALFTDEKKMLEAVQAVQLEATAINEHLAENESADGRTNVPAADMIRSIYAEPLKELSRFICGTYAYRRYGDAITEALKVNGPPRTAGPPSEPAVLEYIGGTTGLIEKGIDKYWSAYTESFEGALENAGKNIDQKAAIIQSDLEKQVQMQARDKQPASCIMAIAERRIFVEKLLSTLNAFATSSEKAAIEAEIQPLLALFNFSSLDEAAEIFQEFSAPTRKFSREHYERRMHHILSTPEQATASFKNQPAHYLECLRNAISALAQLNPPPSELSNLRQLKQLAYDGLKKKPSRLKSFFRALFIEPFVRIWQFFFPPAPPALPFMPIRGEAARAEILLFDAKMSRILPDELVRKKKQPR